MLDTVYIVRLKLSHLPHRVYLERIQDGWEHCAWRGDKRDGVLARPLHHYLFQDLCSEVLWGVVPAAVPRRTIDENVESPRRAARQPLQLREVEQQEVSCATVAVVVQRRVRAP